jgi:hypothetical protein
VDYWEKVGEKEDGKVFQPDIPLPLMGLFHKPILIKELDPAASTM